jgi:nucleoid-associated protein YgaU
VTATHLVHLVAAGERWDTIAYRYYGDATRYGPIIDANVALYLGTLGPLPTHPEVGTKLKIPLLTAASTAEAPDLPPWLRTV